MQQNDKLPASDRHPRHVADLLVVIAAALGVSLPFAGKAIHIDDPLYLNIAHQILVNPLRPFDGFINWQQVTEPAWRVSISPPGYSYWLALWMALGVTGERGLHLAGCFWIVLLGLATYTWARRLGQWPLPATLIVLGSPLVAAGSNLMLDVPMLALAMTAMVVYLRAAERNSPALAVAAGLLAGLATNFKYSGLVATIVMACDTLLCRRWRLLPAATLGFLLLSIGQLTVAFKDGQTQLQFARQWVTQLWPSDSRDMVHRTVIAVMYLGCAAAWPGLVCTRDLWRKAGAIGAGLITAVGAGITAIDLVARESTAGALPIAYACLFASSGWITIAWILQRVLEVIRIDGAGTMLQKLRTGDLADSSRHAVMLTLWTAGFWYLGTLKGPFVAPRHLLPCVVSVVLGILALSPESRRTRRWFLGATVLATAVLGMLVGAGDYRWAAVYREWAPRLAERYRPVRNNLYFLGHWGWQHYAEQAGIIQLDPARTRLRAGDMIILPRYVDCPLRLPLVLAGCREVAVETVADPGWLPRTCDPLCLMFLHADSKHRRVPWGWGPAGHPLEVFQIYRYGD